MRNRIEPLNALTHPVWLIALGLLIFNDHFLKASELAPAVSGKLSDFAGLIVAPVLLAAVLRVKSNRGLWACAASVVAVFSAINLSPAIAAWWDAAVSTVVPYRTTVDPTDLVALAVVPLAFVVFRSRMLATLDAGRVRRRAQVALAAFGVLMCTATSTDESCTTDSDCYEGDVCENEWCSPAPVSCNSDADCPEGHMECAENECSYRPTCDSGADCPSGTCEVDGRCDLAGMQISSSGTEMMDDLEMTTIDEQSIRELESRPIQSIDPALLDYLHDDATPVSR